jgi:hypothetical protein
MFGQFAEDMYGTFLRIVAHAGNYFNHFSGTTSRELDSSAKTKYLT